MNKHEAIKKVEQMGEYERFVNESIPKLSVLNILNQLDEPQKVVVLQFVAEHIKYAKEHDWDLQDAMDFTEDNSELSSWFYTDNNMEIFARAWLDGYEVNKEKRYLVKLKGVPNGAKFLKYAKVTQEWYFGMKRHYSNREIRHTRKQLEEAGFGWVFDCPGIEIEEVE